MSSILTRRANPHPMRHSELSLTILPSRSAMFLVSGPPVF
jgi:hypothetical protein